MYVKCKYTNYLTKNVKYSKNYLGKSVKTGKNYLGKSVEIY